MTHFEQIVLFRELRWRLQLSLFLSKGLHLESMSVKEIQKEMNRFFSFETHVKLPNSFCSRRSCQQYQNDFSATEIALMPEMSAVDPHISIKQLINEIIKEEGLIYAHMTIFQKWEWYMRHKRQLVKKSLDAKTYFFYRIFLLSELEQLKIKDHMVINLTLCIS